MRVGQRVSRLNELPGEPGIQTVHLLPESSIARLDRKKVDFDLVMIEASEMGLDESKLKLASVSLERR